MPLPPLADAAALVKAMAKAHRRLGEDLRERAADPRVAPTLRAAHAEERAKGQTSDGYEAYRDGVCDQVAASWVLCAVFVRTLEDRGYLQHRLAGPGAADKLAQFRASFRFLGERDYLLHIFEAISLLPGAREVFGQGFAPLWRLGPTSRAVGELLAELRAEEGGRLRFTFGRPRKKKEGEPEGQEGEEEEDHDGASTRYLGDLYQDLNEDVRKRYALLQTPEFVERFLLDHTVDQAVRERGIAVTVCDPACGSGHMLLGAYDRLYWARRVAEPGMPAQDSARKALSQVHGIDLNPYAVAVARFRLLLSYLDKAKIPRLDATPGDLPIQVYVGDSLLAGLGGGAQAELGDVFEKKGTKEHGLAKSIFSFSSPEADELLLKKRFDVVVANPPYITEKDPGKRDLIREHYKAASGKFALSAPFVERIFQLGNEGGWTAQITANSFMKREFGKTLIEKVLPSWDLTAVLDTSGAYIPGHGTPTVILFGRAQRPRSPMVRVVMGSRGEPTTPEVPAEGKVWTTIAEHWTEAGHSDEFVSVTDFERSKLEQHPWSLGGGGAAGLKELLEGRVSKRLGELAESIGFGSFTGADDVFLMPAASGPTRWLEPNRIRPIITGDVVRDWSVAGNDIALTPYTADASPAIEEPASRWLRYLWPYRTPLWNITSFAGKTRRDNGDIWWQWYRWVAERYRTPLSITFAFVATHNHFALDRGGNVFSRSAPIIKLPECATEEEHLALLGYLNSSTACFWMKQVMNSKGAGGIGGGYHTETWSRRLEYDGTKLQQLPLPDFGGSRVLILQLSESLAVLGEQSQPAARAVLEESFATPDELRERLSQAIAHCAQVRNRMVALQEELDWRVYCLFGLAQEETCSTEEPPGLQLGQRAFEVLWARRLTREDEPSTDWFDRHGGTPTTVLPESWPRRYAAIVERRMQAISSSHELQLIESGDYKRRWAARDYDDEVRAELESWIYERVEQALQDPRPLSIAHLASALAKDPKVRAVAEVMTGSANHDLEAILGDLMTKEAVACARSYRYTETGLEKRALWEVTWDLQRREDAGEGEKVTIEPPPKYDQKDFENAAVVWRLRGKLDVPKERFIAYPMATPASGASGKAALVFGWAGWDQLQQLQAAIDLWQLEIGIHGHEILPAATRKEREEALGAEAEGDPGLRLDAEARERLLPLLQTMADLLPWVRQWHDEDGETASAFEAYLSEQARRLDTALEAARVYRRPARAAARGRKVAAPREKAAAPRVNAVADPEALVEAVRALDHGEGAPVAALGEQLGWPAAAVKKAVDALVAEGRLVEKKKRPRLVAAAAPAEP